MNTLEADMKKIIEETSWVKDAPKNQYYELSYAYDLGRYEISSAVLRVLGKDDNVLLYKV